MDFRLWGCFMQPLRPPPLGFPTPPSYSKAQGQSLILLHTQKLVNIHNLEGNITKMLIFAIGAVLRAPGALFRGSLGPPHTQMLGACF